MDVPTPDLVTLTQKIIMHSNINLCRHRVQQNTCTYIFLNSDNIDFAICIDHSFALNAFFFTTYLAIPRIPQLLMNALKSSLLIGKTYCNPTMQHDPQGGSNVGCMWSPSESPVCPRSFSWCGWGPFDAVLTHSGIHTYRPEKVRKQSGGRCTVGRLCQRRYPRRI